MALTGYSILNVNSDIKGAENFSEGTRCPVRFPMKQKAKSPSRCLTELRLDLDEIWHLLNVSDPEPKLCLQLQAHPCRRRREYSCINAGLVWPSTPNGANTEMRHSPCHSIQCTFRFVFCRQFESSL
jgi:hypothetical protein